MKLKKTERGPSVTAVRGYSPSQYCTFGWISALFAAALSIFYLLTMRYGHNSGDDFSQYIHHAANMVNGIPYKQTGHILNPNNSIGPETYPPVLPLLLAPLYAIYGIDLEAFKMLETFLFAGFILVLYHVLAPRLSPAWAFLLVVLTGLNPFFWEFKENILSEYPFLFFLFWSIFFMDRAVAADSRGKALAWWLVTGLFVYLVYGTRSIGMLLLPAMFVQEIMRRNKPVGWWQNLVALTAVFALGFVAQHLYLNSEGESYVDQFYRYFNAGTVRNNWKIYTGEFILFLGAQSKTLLAAAIFYIFLFGAVAGLLLRLVRKGPTVMEVFPVLYTIFILLWPMNQLMRFLLPLVPFLFFYVCYLVLHLHEFRWRAGRNRQLVSNEEKVRTSSVLLRYLKPRQLFAGTYLLLICNYIYYLHKAEKKRPVEWRFDTPETFELFSWVDYTPEDAVFIFHKPRALGLYTGRRASVGHCIEKPEEFGDYMRMIGSRYLIFDKGLGECHFSYVEANPDDVKKVFENRTYSVYQVMN